MGQGFSVDESASYVDSRDRFSLLMMIEDGRFLQNIREYFITCPKDAPIVTLVACPYLALIEHDFIRFARSKLGVSHPFEWTTITEIRHRTKYLRSAKGSDWYERYAEECRSTSNILQLGVKKHGGFLDPSMNRVQPDTAIFYAHGLPIGTVHTIALNLGFSDSVVSKSALEEYSLKLGYEIGLSGALLNETVRATGFYADSNTLGHLEISRKDARQSSLLVSIRGEAAEEAQIPIAFFCSNLLCNLCLACTLLKSGIAPRRVFYKMMIVNLCHGNQSIKSLLSYAHRPANQGLLSARLLEDLGLVFPRGSRKLIEKLRPMRNALVHYDFRQFPESGALGGEHADYAFINVLKRLAGMTLGEFDEFLLESTTHACALLSDLLGIGFG